MNTKAKVCVGGFMVPEKISGRLSVKHSIDILSLMEGRPWGEFVKNIENIVSPEQLEHAEIEFDYGYEGLNTIYLNVLRPETDEERLLRIEGYIKQEERKKKNQKKQEEDDRKEYLRLKKKFERIKK